MTLTAIDLSHAAPGESRDDRDYWYSLIDTPEAAAFCSESEKTFRKRRCEGGGPKFIRLSARSIKYRRADLREWAEARLRTSTSDQGEAA